MTETTCPTCDKTFDVKPHKLRDGKQPFCSRRCRAKGQARSGALNPNWKGGVVVNCGRVFIYCPGHPEAKYLGGGTYALRARLEASKKIGRPLREGEVVHHVNGNSMDDRHENLDVLPSLSAHAQLESEKRTRNSVGQYQ